MKTPIVGIFRDEQAAIGAIEALKAEGWRKEDISVVSRSREEIRQVEVVTGTNGAEGMAAGAVTGALLGGTAGMLATAGLLFIPGIGPLLAAGPVAVFLTGMAVGGSAGTLVGGLVGLGIPEIEAENYRALIENDHLLVIASATTEAERTRIESIYHVYGTIASAPRGHDRLTGEGASEAIRVHIGSKAAESTLDSPIPVQEFTVFQAPAGEEQ